MNEKGKTHVCFVSPDCFSLNALSIVEQTNKQTNINNFKQFLVVLRMLFAGVGVNLAANHPIKHLNKKSKEG